MQSLDLTGSFVVGSLVLLTLLGIYFYYNSYSQTNIYNEIAQRDITALSEIIDRDLDNIGHQGTAAAVPSIVTMKDTALKFTADMDNSNTVLETVRYQQITSGTPAVTYLRRTYTANGNSLVTNFKVDSVKFLYYQADGTTVTNNAAAVRCIRVQLTYNNSNISAEQKNNAIRVLFDKRYFPKNL